MKLDEYLSISPLIATKPPLRTLTNALSFSCVTPHAINSLDQEGAYGFPVYFPEFIQLENSQ